MVIQLATSDDYDLLADVMFDAVRNGPSAYDASQRKAWLPEPPAGAKWIERLERQSVFVALVDESRIGFMSCDKEGYIDLAFVRPNWQGRGVFRQLYQTLEESGRAAGLRRLWVNASLNAAPAFKAVGFETIKQESIQVRDEYLDRYVMEKLL